jgi:hypothetical protein
MEARFLISDMVRAMRDKTVLKTSDAYMVRDYLTPSDFYGLVIAILVSPATNTVLDCYSKAPIDKSTLLTALQAKFGLQYEVLQSAACVNATGNKPHYYSLNKRAEDFGYQPVFTALQGVLQESALILDSKAQ